MPAYFEKKRNDELAAWLFTSIDSAPHLHPQMELMLVLSGEVMVTVHNQSKVLTPGSIAVCFPNEIHSYTSLVPDTAANLVIWDLSYTGGYMDTLLQNHPINPFLEPDQIHPNIPYAIEEIIKESSSPVKSSVYTPFIQLILARLLSILTLQRNKSNDYPELTYKISNYMNENYQAPLTLGILAQELGISKYHLSHLFSEKMGQNFSAYLASIRLSRACKLLAESQISVTDIAEKSGFESQITFFRAFKAHFGVTPLKYRQTAQHSKINS